MSSSHFCSTTAVLNACHQHLGRQERFLSMNVEPDPLQTLQGLAAGLPYITERPRKKHEQSHVPEPPTLANHDCCLQLEDATVSTNSEGAVSVCPEKHQQKEASGDRLHTATQNTPGGEGFRELLDVWAPRPAEMNSL